MTTWAPGDPWPSGTTGGAGSPHWGGFVRLWVRAAIAAGTPFHMGPHPADRLDAGNVLAGAPGDAGGGQGGDSLWVDLSCDVLDLDLHGGATGEQGIFSKADAAVVTITLADPSAKYDPLNAHGPYSFGGRSRLIPGVPVEVWAEVVNGDDGTWQRFDVFTGTADSWGEDWVPDPRKRTATLVATDGTKELARLDRPEQPATGAGDTTGERVARILTFFDWAGTVDGPASGGTVTLAATTLAQSAWELLNRALDDELGSIFFAPDGRLRWTDRTVWSTITSPVGVFGCDGVEPGAHDVIIDAKVSSLELQIKNAVYAARSGGTTSQALSDTSIAKYGEHSYKRTDLGLADDTQTGQWAADVLTLYAYPQIALQGVTMLPAVDPRSFEPWAVVLGVEHVTDLVLVAWAPPDHPEHVVRGLVRVVGVGHRITRRSWEVEWQLVAAQSITYAGSIFTMGPHAQDRLDAGYVLAASPAERERLLLDAY